MSEITVAYNRLKKQWSGFARRQHQPRTKGIEDYMLVQDGVVIFAEVKWHDGKRAPKLSRAQAENLVRLQKYGANVCVLMGYGRGLEARWVVFKRDFRELAEMPLRPDDGRGHETDNLDEFLLFHFG